MLMNGMQRCCQKENEMRERQKVVEILKVVMKRE